MTRFQWFSPTPEQLAEAKALAARLGVEPVWEGDLLTVADPAAHEQEPEPAPIDPRREALIAAGFSPAQADLILAAVG